MFPAAFVVAVLAFSSAAQAPRLVTVVTKPDAKVWIGGVFYGVTDGDGKLKVKTEARGQRTIRVRADGFGDTTKVIPAGASGITVEVPVTKTASPAELAFQEGERQASLDRGRSIAAYQEAIKLDPKHAAAHIALARSLSATADHEGALRVLADLKRASPRNAEGSAVEGRIYESVGEEAKAIAAFKRSIAEGRGFQPEAYTGLGLLYKERAETLAGEDEAKAEAAFAEAAKNLAMAVKQLSGAPDAVVIMQLLGLIYEDQKKYKEAIAIYERFLELFPESVEAEAVRSFIVQIRKEMARGQ